MLVEARGDVVAQQVGDLAEVRRMLADGLGEDLPAQARDGGFVAAGVRAELDGELAHPGRATADDLIRDNDVRLALDEITLRYRWPHVWDTPCLVAGQVAAALQKRGWQKDLMPCSPGCVAPAVLASLTVSVA